MPRPDTEPPCSHSLSHKLAKLLVPIEQSGQNTHLHAHPTPQTLVYVFTLSYERKAVSS